MQQFGLVSTAVGCSGFSLKIVRSFPGSGNDNDDVDDDDADGYGDGDDDNDDEDDDAGDGGKSSR